MGYRYCRNCTHEFDSEQQTDQFCPKCHSPKWTLLMPIQEQAHRAVAKALRHGIIIKTGCAVCGNHCVEAHHDDYRKPLKVIWLCKVHHKIRHIELAKDDRDPAKLIRFRPRKGGKRRRIAKRKGK